MKDQTRKTTTTKQDFETIVATYNNHPDDETALLTLATVCTYAVLKKVADPQRKTTDPEKLEKYEHKVADSGCNPTILRVKREVSHDLKLSADLTTMHNNKRVEKHDKNGDVYLAIDPESWQTAPDHAYDRFGDGMDFVNDAVLAILEETAKQLARNPSDPVDLTRPYEVRQLRKKVWIKTEEAENAWETVKTTPIQEVFRAIRRSIQNSRSFRIDPKNGYLYLDEMVKDGQTGEETNIYRRFPRYADLGGAVCDFNGQTLTPTTVDSETAETIDDLVTKLNLTERQALILKYRLSGYGKKAIATRLGVGQKNVAESLKAMQKKAQAIGLTI